MKTLLKKSSIENTSIMKQRKLKLARIIFGFFLILLLLPYLQNTIRFIKVPELKGYFVKAEKTEFSIDSWLNGSFQEKQEKYINENFGYRNALIRLYNQLSFDIFKSVKINDVVVGKDNYLFQQNYIDAYLGTNFQGFEKISTRMEKLKFIQEEFKKKNKTVLLVIAPGKASFYPEYLPDYVTKEQNKPTNYGVVVQEIAKNKIEAIDFSRYFLEQKSKSPYSLYPKHGIHWSFYGMTLALDSLLHKIEKLRGISMSQLYWDELEMSLPKEGDDDILEGMNLLFPLEGDSMAYPQIKIRDVDNQVKPSLLVIGDSFYKQMLRFTPKFFSENKYWYYNREVWPPDDNKSNQVKDYDLKETIDKYDVFIILATEINHEIGWGFIENSYSLLKFGFIDMDKAEFNKKVQSMKKYIRSRKDWMKLVEEKALKNRLSIDSALTNDAIWMVRNSNN